MPLSKGGKDCIHRHQIYRQFGVDRGLLILREAQPAARTFVVYRGHEELVVDGTRVLPVELFLHNLHAGTVLGPQ